MLQNFTRVKDKYYLTIITGAEKLFVKLSMTFLISQVNTLTTQRNYLRIVEGTYVNQTFPTVKNCILVSKI